MMPHTHTYYDKHCIHTVTHAHTHTHTTDSAHTGHKQKTKSNITNCRIAPTRGPPSSLRQRLWQLLLLLLLALLWLWWLGLGIMQLRVHDLVVLLQVLLARQALAADVALEGRQAGVVHQAVAGQHLLAAEQLQADIALEGLVLRVGGEVVLEVALVRELLVADAAGEGLGLQVLLHVDVEVLLLLEVLAAHVAHVAHGGRAHGQGGHAGPGVVLLHVLVEVQLAGEHLAAHLAPERNTDG